MFDVSIEEIDSKEVNTLINEIEKAINKVAGVAKAEYVDSDLDENETLEADE